MSEIIKEPLISIVVPVYNTSEYLDRFVKSVLCQSFYSFEIIFVNDGSSDNSSDIIKKYNDSRIVLVEKENGGVSSARNAGIELARGKYICFFDSDDTIEKETLKICVNSIKDNDLLVFCYRDIISENHSIPHNQQAMAVSSKSFFEDVFFFASRMQIYSPCNKMYVRKIIVDNNLLFEKDLKIGEDYLFNLSYIKHCKKILFSNDVLYNYHHQNSMSAINKYDSNMPKFQFRVVLETHKFKKNESIYEKEYIIKRMVYLFRYFKTKNIDNIVVKDSMKWFYDNLNSINIANNSKTSAKYNIPYKLLINKHYNLLNICLSIICNIIFIKNLLKRRKCSA